MEDEKENSIAEKILEILENENATVKDFSKKIGVKENIIRTTINRMKKYNLVSESGLHRDRYKVYTLGKFDEKTAKRFYEVESQFIDKLTTFLLDRKERQTIFRRYKNDPDTIYSEENDIKMGYLIESLLQTARSELLDDPDFIKELKKKLSKLA